MPNEFDTSIDRRKFMRASALTGALLAGGCGGGDAVQTVETPPAKGGNRERLDAAQGKFDAAASKKKG
jgi:hypothetical protein